jgi:hypothetical protein
VVVAAALTVLGVADDLIAEEYLLSAGARPELIRRALHGLRALDLPATQREVLRRNLGRVT